MIRGIADPDACMLESTSRPSRRERHWIQFVLWATLGITCAVLVATHADYGPTYDAAVQAHYGELALDYFRSAGANTSANEFIDLRFYGPLYEMLPAWLYEGTGANRFELRHLFHGLLAASMIPALWWFGRKFADPRVAAFAVLIVATMPRFYGQWCNNSKDGSFAVAVVWLMLALVHMFGTARLRWGRTALCGLAMGLALCSRSGGLPLFAVFAAAAGGCWLLSARAAEAARFGPRLLQLCLHGATVIAVAWPVMVAPWPWAHEAPFANPIAAILEATEFTTTLPVLFDGQTLRSDSLPRRYIAQYVLIGTPLSVLLLALVGALAALRDVLARWGSSQASMAAVTLVWFAVPIALFALMRPNVYGGMRHFLFVLPGLAVLAALGCSSLLGLLRAPRARLAGWVALTGIALLPAIDMVRLHPYQATFYNALVGGTAGAQGRYWTDYPLTSYREAIAWLNDRAREQPNEKLLVVMGGAKTEIEVWTEEFTAPNLELIGYHTLRQTDTLGPARYFLATTRNDVHLHFPDLPVVHTIGRAGATFAVIKERR